MVADEAELKGLFLHALQGDSSSYGVFLKQCSNHLRAFIRRRLARYPDDVEDLLQETLLAIHNQRHTYDPGYPLTAWMYAIARYKVIDLLRRNPGYEVEITAMDNADELFLHTDMAADEARRDLGKLLEQLPDRQRLPIVHVKLEGLSVAEVATRLGMSVSAVKIGIHRGLKALAAQLRDTP